jgi:hypothetical protein
VSFRFICNFLMNSCPYRFSVSELCTNSVDFGVLTYHILNTETSLQFPFNQFLLKFCCIVVNLPPCRMQVDVQGFLPQICKKS